MAEIVIRKMHIIDVDAVMEVENATFSTPWTTDIFYQELVDNDYAHYFVMEADKKIIGYVGLWLVIDDAQITNIAIMPGYRGNKLGEKLFGFTIQQILLLGGTRLSLEVRKSNTIAQRMYRKFGLVPGGIRKNYYTDNQEDAIVMWVNLL
ncbi:ribosomal protein S18-alanine N-acetyltransferase [Virgibacillus halodenitrificans]|jgi:[ribosomal protein S18]-alanine N-acetyltransferase|uniref:[Ribosomal protein bS18]-alanine N-acetyltransferase n=1 Tax=Virgibacillus halodenitrificans TaxID=1482 RepID=A0AAC9IXI6_VIRHA|nr:ribosomal protein S18-alanine N-acetyltransferase [Virgibacillus halodenitrificans]APC47118.1 ribosomal-protein-alanine N-acetyltransferase [Virgibacillus halodenitrificans]MCG1027932.1 ribosomal protein S18-alanine N-acetyltransferase [Virgibacillus halodenitrificans]MCJ0931813.1 ribosomal protein S18-alanine N-acetyltransferase [Virgibacillus halodenitrificans]MEC2159467.1 ribosomal protein S18-alanine N-acetyltransferase [Virgibacillus halodenitrificans]MYL47797.1 ribosomal-protein-alani